MQASQDGNTQVVEYLCKQEGISINHESQVKKTKTAFLSRNVIVDFTTEHLVSSNNSMQKKERQHCQNLGKRWCQCVAKEKGKGKYSSVL